MNPLEGRPFPFSAQRIIVQASVTNDQAVSLEGDPLAALLFRDPRQGEIITITDISGREFRARITQLGQDRAIVYPFEELSNPTEPPFKLFLFQALPAKERMELIIEKTTELGVSVIVPFRSAHSITLEERELRQPKAHHWHRIALKAAKQCRRAAVPVVAPYCSFEQVLEIACSVEIKILLLENEKTRLLDLLRATSPPIDIALMVGPEGGWEEGEVQEAIEAGFRVAGLGGRILRTETAAIVACAILQYEWKGL